jgi:hypothetical protein
MLIQFSPIVLIHADVEVGRAAGEVIACAEHGGWATKEFEFATGSSNGSLEILLRAQRTCRARGGIR